MYTTPVLCIMLVLLAVAPVKPPPNEPPVANDDIVIVQFEPTYVDIEVLENDYDPEGAPLTVMGVPVAEGGKAVVLKGQVVRVYLPANLSAPEGAYPLDPIAKGTYLVSDGVSASMAQWHILLLPQ